jgi:glucan phosphoethanolaminetransferase (alkaline phosphatase superfamily)
MTFLEALAEQRWDDHRYYHHSRINQALHLISALTFICAYGLLFVEPALAALLAWLVAMPSRQIGHFFFEPRGYDTVNQATHEYKEDVKVGYNLRRKVVLMSVWMLSPLLLVWSPTLFGTLHAHHDWWTFTRNVSVLWLSIGVGAVAFRTIQLFFLRNVQAGLVWAAKILTDPFHDVTLYYKSPLYLLRGELVDPMFNEAAPHAG